MWQLADVMMIEAAPYPGHMASLICFMLVILNFVQVIKWLTASDS